MLQMLLVQRLNVLPEPQNDLVSGSVVGVEGVFLHVKDVNLTFAIDDHVELVGLEDREKVVGDDLVDAQAEVLNHFEYPGCAVVLHAE